MLLVFIIYLESLFVIIFSLVARNLSPILVPRCRLNHPLIDIQSTIEQPIKSINRVTDLVTQLSKEIDLFTSEGR